MKIKCLIFRHDWLYSNKKEFFDNDEKGISFKIYTRQTCKNCKAEQELENAYLDYLGRVNRDWVRIK